MLPRVPGPWARLPKISTYMRSLLAAGDASAAAVVLSVMKLAGGQNLTGGFTGTPYDHGSKSGTTSFTPEPDLCFLQKVSFAASASVTINAPTKDGAFVLMITNAGTVTAVNFSGFEKLLAGDAYAITSGNKYAVFIYGFNSVQFYQIVALQ